MLKAGINNAPESDPSTMIKNKGRSFGEKKTGTAAAGSLFQFQ